MASALLLAAGLSLSLASQRAIAPALTPNQTLVLFDFNTGKAIRNGEGILLIA
jgi:hypothetical protein